MALKKDVVGSGKGEGFWTLNTISLTDSRSLFQNSKDEIRKILITIMYVEICIIKITKRR